MKKLSAILILLFLGSVPVILEAAPRNIGAFGNVRTGAARMPFYKNQQLEYFLRSRSMTMRGKFIDAVWPMIDSVQKGVSVETIAKADNKSEVYKLNSPLETVQEFWRKRSYSAGVVVTPSALFDQAQRSASGSEKVFMRSPMLDLNGVGFTADFNRHVIKILSNVEIVLRNSGGRSIASPLSAMDQDKRAETAKSKITSTLAYCDEMLIDTRNNRITLSGHVRVFDPAGTITSEKLEIEFGDAPAGSKSAAKKSKSNTAQNKDQKLRIARFIGKVHAVRKLDAAEAADGEQSAHADLMIYNAMQDMIEMTGSRPKLMRGSDKAEAERIVILPDKKIIRFFDKCFFRFQREKSAGAQPDLVHSDYADWNYPENLIRLIGNARFNSPSDKSELKADRIEITLADRIAGKSGRPAAGKATGKRPEKSVADGNVFYKRNNNGVAESASAGRMTYNARAEEIHLENKPVIQRGGDVIRGGEMRYNIAKERMIVNRSSQITLAGATVGTIKNTTGGAADGVTVNSRRADLNYGGNKLAFDGNVAVRGRGMKLDSDKLDIDLAADGRKSAKDGKTRKLPVRALAVGNVQAEDASGTLSTGELDVRLGDKAVPGKVEIEKIFARNKVRLQSKPGKDSGKKSSTLLGKSADGTTTLDAERGEMDLITNVADFYEKVVIKDSSVKLECGHLHLIAGKTAQPVPALNTYKQRDEFPDRLAIGEDRELIQVVANKDVRIFRTLPTGEIQRARGDKSVYTVKERKVVMTCDPPGRPQALTADSGMIGDRVMIDLDSEELYVENGDVLTRLNDMGL